MEATSMQHSNIFWFFVKDRWEGRNVQEDAETDPGLRDPCCRDRLLLPGILSPGRRFPIMDGKNREVPGEEETICGNRSKNCP